MYTPMRILVAIAAALSLATPCAADDALWQRLADGGRIVLVRHAVTTPGVGDPPGMRLEDCATQRNLTDEGRRHARAIGAAFRERRIPIARVLSSPWCRCLETARLAFGVVAIEPSLANLFGRPGNSTGQVEAMRAIVAAHRGRENLVLVSHGSTILALTGVSPATGEMVIVSAKPDGSFAVDGRLSVPG